MPFTLHADFNLIDGTDSTKTKSVEIQANTQITGPSGVIFDDGKVAVTAGVLTVELPATDDTGVEPADFGFTVRRDTGRTRVWQVPAALDGVTVELTDYTATTPLPVTPTEVEQAEDAADRAEAAATAAALVGSVLVADNGDGTVTITTAGGGAWTLTDNGDGTADISLDGDTVTVGHLREVANGVAGLTASGKLYEARIPDRLSDAALSAVIGSAIGSAKKMYHLDSYNDFFGGGKWITGQATAATSLTAGVSAGASVLPVASASGLSAGVQLLVAEGTANQAIYSVASVASNDVTIVGTVTYALSNGAAVTPLWTNSAHLTTPGYRAFAYFIANARDEQGSYVITGTTPRVTYLGNSWISQGTTVWGDELDDRIAGATAVNAGVTGNTSTQLLARFDTDVAADSDYVVFNEPGVNDDTNVVSPATQAANLQLLVQKIRAIGATPIYTGHVPLADFPTYSAARQTQVDALIGDGSVFPGAGVSGVAAGVPYVPQADSLGIGAGALLTVTTGVENTVIGARAGDAMTSGGGNTLFGREAGTGLTTGLNNTGVGHNALRVVVSGANNVAVGQGSGAAVTGSGATLVGGLAGLSMTTATDNTAIGKSAGYAPAGVAGNATTTAIQQTIVGSEAGQGSSGQANGITAIGYRAVVTGASGTALGINANAAGSVSVAIGAGASAPNSGAVAIGCDSSAAGAATVANNEIALGTANHTTRIRGRLQIDTWQSTVGAAGAASALPASPTKYLYVKDSSGVELVIPAFAKV